MHLNWQERLSTLQDAIEKCFARPVPEGERVSFAFRYALESWEALRNDVGDASFENISEEIYFFKCIKPSFTSWLEYLPMVYLGISFQPKVKVHAREYWKEETHKLQKFIDKNMGFVAYYRSGKTHLDKSYFLPGSTLPFFESRRFYDRDESLSTLYDPLVALLLAHERYFDYVSKKLVVFNT